jgi:hypothetical protein
MDHLLSLVVFGGAAAEFLLLPKFGTSTFFLLTLFALVDFLTGVTLRRRRYTVAAAPAPVPVPSKAEREPEPQANDPVFAPAPAQAAPPPAPPVSPVTSAASVAESVLLDHPGPALAQPAVASPGIQPGNGVHSSPDASPR